jgi:hypothetical protein
VLRDEDRELIDVTDNHELQGQAPILHPFPKDLSEFNPLKFIYEKIL